MSEKAKSSFVRNCKECLSKLQDNLWNPTKLNLKGPVGYAFTVLRILTLVMQGAKRNKLPGQAAALSYYSLIALGPMLALAIMISSFVFQDTDEDLAARTLNDIIGFIAAPAALNLTDADNNGPLFNSEDDINPELLALINTIVDSARSGTAGVLGSLVLIWISIQLFISIENSFNAIWGVQRGRSMLQRIVFYWTLLSLGAVLTFASVVLISANTIARAFSELPGGEFIYAFLLWGAPALSFLLLVLLMTVFNRFIPNTYVNWRAAIIGGVLVVLLLFINKEINHLYINYVLRQQSLYGSVGIVPLLMFGLYLFWLFILIGGQVTYAIQNVRSLTSLKAWDNVSIRTVELVSLGALNLIAKRFKECNEPLTADTIARDLRVPLHLLNICLRHMCEIRYISPVESRDENGLHTIRYQPARPLATITLGNFKQALEERGNNAGAHLFDEQAPLIRTYLGNLNTAYTDPENLDKSLDTLLEK